MSNLKIKTIPRGWREEIFSDLIVENQKSKIKVGEASNNCEYKFFTSGAKVLTFDNFLVDKENIFLSTGGKASIKYFNGRSSYSTDTYSIKTNKKIFTKYFYYFLLSKINYIDKNLFTGSGLKHLQKNDFKKLKLLLPLLSEQNKIAEILSKVDEDIEKTDEIIQKADELKKGLMRELLTKGIGRWKPVSFMSCVDKLSLKKVKGMKKTKYSTKGKFPIFDQAKKYISGYTDDYKLVNKNFPAILFGDHTRVVKYINTLYAVGADGTKVFNAVKEVDQRFLYYTLLNLDIPNTGYNRHFKWVKESKILLPSIKEQKQIAEILSSVDGKIEINKQIKNKLTQLKKGLMNDLLSGRVRVSTKI